MKQHQDIAFNDTSGSLHYDAPEGRASSIDEVEIHAWDTGDDASSEWTVSTTSIDSVNTTFDANSGVSSTNPKLCNLAATTSIAAGREYLATDAMGRKEWVEVVAISSTASVTARAPLFNDYVSGDTFVGTRLSTTVNSSWIADTGNISPGNLHHPYWRVRWVYTVSSVQYVAYSTFDVVRYPAKHGVTPNDIELMVPGFLTTLPLLHRQDQGAGFIDEAYRQFRLDLYQERIDDSAIRDADVVKELTAKKAISMWAELRVLNGQGDTTAADRAKAMYWDRFTAIFKSPSEAKAPIAADTSGGGSIVMSQPITVR